MNKEIITFNEDESKIEIKKCKGHLYKNQICLGEIDIT